MEINAQSNAKQRWLFKSEPTAYSIEDLRRDKKTAWDGVRNYQVRNWMRDQMVAGQRFIFYHSSCAIPAAVGVGEITDKAKPDLLQFDSKSKYYDSTSPVDNPRWLMVPVKFVKLATEPYPLSAMRAEPKLEGFRLLQRASRLSVVPVSAVHWQVLIKAMKL